MGKLRACELFDKTYCFAFRVEVMIRKCSVLMLHGKFDEAHDLIEAFYRQENYCHNNFYQIKLIDCQFLPIGFIKFGFTQEIFCICDLWTRKGNVFLRDSCGFDRVKRINLYKQLRRVHADFYYDPTENCGLHLYNELRRARESSDIPKVGINEKSLSAIVRKYQQGRYVKGRGLPAKRKRKAAILN